MFAFGSGVFFLFTGSFLHISFVNMELIWFFVTVYLMRPKAGRLPDRDFLISAPGVFTEVVSLSTSFFEGKANTDMCFVCYVCLCVFYLK